MIELMLCLVTKRDLVLEIEINQEVRINFFNIIE